MKTFLIFLVFFSSLTYASETRVPEDYYDFPELLVKVSSVLYDTGEDQSVRVTGVGSIVKIPQSRTELYILTAGHIALGSDLEITLPNNKTLTVEKIFVDESSDLALLQISQNPQAELKPLAIYSHTAQVFVTNFQLTIGPKFYQEGERWSYLATTNGHLKYPSFIIDGAKNFQLFGGPGLTRALLAVWLPLPNFQLNPGETVIDIPTSLRTKQFNSYLRFNVGYSGTPSASPAIFSNGDKFYILSGILTASQKGHGSSSFAGHAAIKNLVEKALKNRTTPFNFQWALYKGHFLLLDVDITLFIDSGPVGNGVVINGLTPAGEREKNKVVQTLIKKTGQSKLEIQILQLDKIQQPEKHSQTVLPDSKFPQSIKFK